MIIIPTEKRFDWKHAPLVLISIVLINIIIYVAYQSGDDQKQNQALNSYFKSNFIKTEWPLFEKYLQQNQEQQLSDDLSSSEDIIKAQYILTRVDFYDYLESYHSDIALERERVQIQNTMESISYIAFGLYPEKFSIVTLFTHQFLHGDLMHLLGNLFFLIVCGFAVEAAIGHWRFLAFYLGAGVAGGLMHSFFGQLANMPLVGASGAISGVMAMYVSVFRLRKIEFFYWFFVFVGYFRVPALLILPFYIGKEAYDFFFNDGSNVAFMAHIGGFIAGFVAIVACLLINPKMIDSEYIEEDQSIDPYQHDLAEVYRYLERFQFAKAKECLEIFIKKYGTNFDLSLLHYQLSSIHPDLDTPKILKNLFTFHKLTDAQIIRQHKVWRDNPNFHEQLSPDLKTQLALNLAKLPDPRDAQVICEQLLETHYRDPSLAVLARRLSQAYENNQEPAKAKQFNTLAEQLLAGTY